MEFLISIVTVTFNSGNAFDGFKESLRRIEHLLPETELLVHDNTFHNIGLSKAVNLLLQRSRGDMILLANPDVIFNETIQYMVEFVRRTGFCAVPEFVGSNVNRRFPTFTRIVFSHSMTGAVFQRLNLIKKEYTRPSSRVEQPGGSFLLMTRKTMLALSQHGYFYDPQFPVFWNDVDLSMRAKELGIKCSLVDRCKIEHYGGHSTRQLSNERRLMLFFSQAGMMGFAAKWHMHPRLLMIAGFLDVLGMFMLKPFRTFIPQRVHQYNIGDAKIVMAATIMRFRCTLH